MTCPKCGSESIDIHTGSFTGFARCLDCGYVGTVPEFKAIATATITIKSMASTLRIDTCVYGTFREMMEQCTAAAEPYFGDGGAIHSIIFWEEKSI